MKKNWMKVTAAVLCIAAMFAFVACGTDVSAEASSATAPVLNAKPDGTAGKRVYFAAPMFSHSEKEFNERLTKVLEDNGYEVFLPQRDGIEAALLEGKTEEEMTRMIFDLDSSEVLKADIVFIVLDGRVPDEGACVELGIGYASGKRCYGVKTDTRSVESNMDVNPMITGCLTKLFKDYDGDSLIKALEQYLSENEL